MELHTQEGLWAEVADHWGIEIMLADGFRHDSACEPDCPDGHLLDRHVLLSRDDEHWVWVDLDPKTMEFNLEFRDGGGSPPIVFKIAEPVDQWRARQMLDDYLDGSPEWNAGHEWVRIL